MKRNFKIILSCLLLAVVLMGCGYKVKQEVVNYFWDDNVYLITRLKKNMNAVKAWSDKITLETGDSLKCARYNEAVKWGEKLKSLEAINCK